VTSVDGKLFWTKKKPTKDGWYWRRAYKFKANYICEVRGGVVRRAFNLHDSKLEEEGGEWWGPLREPDLSDDGNTYSCKDSVSFVESDAAARRLYALYHRGESRYPTNHPLDGAKECDVGSVVAAYIALRAETEAFRATHTDTLPGVDGAGVEVPATPESVVALMKELQFEWDAAEARLGAAESKLSKIRELLKI